MSKKENVSIILAKHICRFEEYIQNNSFFLSPHYYHLFNVFSYKHILCSLLLSTLLFIVVIFTRERYFVLQQLQSFAIVGIFFFFLQRDIRLSLPIYRVSSQARLLHNRSLSLRCFRKALVQELSQRVVQVRPGLP